jgi:hypothetical protein
MMTRKQISTIMHSSKLTLAHDLKSSSSARALAARHQAEDARLDETEWMTPVQAFSQKMRFRAEGWFFAFLAAALLWSLLAYVICLVRR